ncbi:hypothetical protein H5410_045369 [Solanum commersonii]|uniref:SWIM-type domain-containing protein n=1 Tax=Solanum commersonii TaxID=4109 RepID=A0A9J5XBE7_SOLCO|nr:hypothetical protein H5410_045369 [Solanum commersonii]
MVSSVERIARKITIKSDSLYLENIIGDDNRFTLFGVGSTFNANILERSCSCEKYDLVKIQCAHAMIVCEGPA